MQTVLGMIGRLRQSLPNSQRLAQLSDTANSRLSAIKNQLHEQAQSALNRANSATALDEKLNLTNDALQLLEEHLRHCVAAAAVGGGPEIDEKVAEATAAIARLLRT